MIKGSNGESVYIKRKTLRKQFRLLAFLTLMAFVICNAILGQEVESLLDRQVKLAKTEGSVQEILTELSRQHQSYCHMIRNHTAGKTGKTEL